jgi:FAD:protein FMN transferase
VQKGRSSGQTVRWAVTLGCVPLLLSVPACFLERTELASRTFRSMGTVATVTVGTTYAGRIEPVTAHIREVFDRLDRELSSYRPDSAISRLSEKAGVAPMAVTSDSYRVLSLSKQFGALSDGAFDITIAPLVSLWGFNGAPVPTSLPSEQDIRERQKLVGYGRLVLRDGTVFLPVKGMGVDVGGIGKGYAVDRAYDYCLSAGIRDFLIDFSGNIRASGRPAWGEKWDVGVRDPFDRSHLIGKIALPGGMALATSGSYERFVSIANERFSHIIDPRTGYPVVGTVSVTVLSPDATAADALSTTFFVVGLKGAGELLKKVPSTELLLVPDKYPLELWLTPGFAKVFTPIPELAKKVKVFHTER